MDIAIDMHMHMFDKHITERLFFENDDALFPIMPLLEINDFCK
jgi:hypothetical protein